jgi:LysR family glycine cleavage system transcriptional activator
VIAGTGIVIVLHSFARQCLIRGMLVAPFDYRLPVAASHFLVQRRSSLPREEVKSFSDWVCGLIPMRFEG